MHIELHKEMPPQKNVISLEDAKKFVGNWHGFIKDLYTGHSDTIPHGFFIPFTDIEELTKLRHEIPCIIKIIDGQKVQVPIYIVGVRAYYCLKEQMLAPKNPVKGSSYPVEAILVAVYQDNPREKGPDEHRYNPHFPTYDLIVKVPSDRDIDEPGDGGDYSIYDITQPCPPLCDSTSDLLLRKK